ncbi:MAG: ImmA/IrrE family metallo-endopeptidase [Ruminococcaceae bacterium]|nr:ImmA/IrrE family metallo-endopeptidase [Oscillospiraceae bacterium]
MFELSDFYGYCQKNQIDVIPYDGCPQPGATIRDRNEYAIFLDFTKIRSTHLLRGICYHELGHAATGALHKVDSPYELVERSEHRAIRWAAEQYLPENELRVAFQSGVTEPWQLAEYFDLPQRDIEKALYYWTVCRGIDFNK